ncbi:MAG TPA: bifunctional DNA-formamidopyrimidine glycosylase/DNA-(apurinic or apyrimidinic site) lyase [Phycisphaerae bacterium]|nr:bifunctional DNA-formamidopyrimidine glycosylase/DNA-(apurinic or apyrimidinic site) lyase [Phycisphaerae bacterium]
MPELPEVETLVRQLGRQLAGRRIRHVELRRPDVLWGNERPACVLLRGRRITRVSRRGKRIILSLTDQTLLIVHLGMTGRLLWAPADQPCAAHTHLCLEFAGQTRQLRFVDPRRFGNVWIARAGGRWIGPVPSPLGPEPLEMTIGQFERLCKRRRAVKAVLLDQQMIAGIGNIYCDETLFRAGIHPATRADRLDRRTVMRLRRALRAVLREAIKARGSTIRDYRQSDGSIGRFQSRHRVYGRAGLPCRRCRGEIDRMVVAGRGTYYCTRCQRPGPPAPSSRPARAR